MVVPTLFWPLTLTHLALQGWPWLGFAGFFPYSWQEKTSSSWAREQKEWRPDFKTAGDGSHLFRDSSLGDSRLLPRWPVAFSDRPSNGTLEPN